MKIRQWEIWKSKPEGFERDHWFVVISGQERLDAPKFNQINGLVCYTLRGQPASTDIVLNAADGFGAPTLCNATWPSYWTKGNSIPISAPFPGSVSSGLRARSRKLCGSAA